MDADLSEGFFAKYLYSIGVKYDRHFVVKGNKNVDFMIKGDPCIFCDVKEVKDSGYREANDSECKLKNRKNKRLDAYHHIRDDVSKLRKKFGKNAGIYKPVMLVTMNFSGNFFTGFTVARALLGDVGFGFDDKKMNYLPAGNAAMTKNQNTLISGIFLFDCSNVGKHYLFHNPYAKNRLPSGIFIDTEEIFLNRDSEDFVRLQEIMFWPK